MRKVLIIGKTRMGHAACIGGLALSGLIWRKTRSVRLLESQGDSYPLDASYEIGEVWEIDYTPVAPSRLRAPHCEDVRVLKRRYHHREPHLRQAVLERVRPWRGAPTELYDGLLQFSDTGRGYISRAAPLPRMSTGFWLPSAPLTLVTANGRARYHCTYADRTYVLPYVGLAPPLSTLPAATLVRVSLARWWQPTPATLDEPLEEERCHLQLSGWFSDDG